MSAPIVPVESNVTVSPEHKVSFERPDVKTRTGKSEESTVTVTVFDAAKSAVPGHWTELIVAKANRRNSVVVDKELGS